VLVVGFGQVAPSPDPGREPLMSAPPPVLTRPLDPSEAHLLTRPLRVLVADDNRDAADTLAELLRLAGAEVEACYDGPAAVRVASWFSPDACLLDLSMPGMDGDEVALRLHEAAGGDRFLLVAVTARGDDEARLRTRAAGFAVHLVKPVDPDGLLAVLSDADWWRSDVPGG
jgi:CheY-like chemotaxis protein